MTVAGGNALATIMFSVGKSKITVIWNIIFAPAITYSHNANQLNAEIRKKINIKINGN